MSIFVLHHELEQRDHVVPYFAQIVLQIVEELFNSLQVFNDMLFLIDERRDFVDFHAHLEQLADCGLALGENADSVLLRQRGVRVELVHVHGVHRGRRLEVIHDELLGIVAGPFTHRHFLVLILFQLLDVDCLIFLLGERVDLLERYVELLRLCDRLGILAVVIRLTLNTVLIIFPQLDHV